MLVLVTSWYAAIDSDRTYHMRVTEYNTILPVLKGAAHHDDDVIAGIWSDGDE